MPERRRPLRMRLLGLVFVIAVAVSAQALPETLQIYAPAPAVSSVRVGTAGDLQAALDRAQPGDVIELEPGATYVGNFVLPRKSGDRYIVVRTAATRGLPDTAGRIGPEHSTLLAKLRSPNGSPVIRTAPGAHHWRLSLLEIGPTAGVTGDVVMLGDASAAQSGPGTPHDLVVDRCLIRGDPERGQKRGIALNSERTTVYGSYIHDIKSTTQDAQAIAGWNGSGPFLIENNYLEASGENFMLGGAVAASGVVPSDLVFRRNHVSKPPEWREQKWSVKNLFELKNARRVLVEGNLFEHNWVAAQPGYAIVLTPRGERGAMPWAVVEDVTFQYNIVRNVAAVFNLLAFDDVGASGVARRIRIAHNLVYDVDREAWGGNGVFMQIGQGPAEVIVEHNTVIQSGNIITAYGGEPSARAKAEGFVFRHNVTLHNANGVAGQGVAPGADALATYFPDAIFTRNVLAGGRATRYPPDNLFPEMDQFVRQFANYEGRDFRLRTDSAFRRAAADGANLGVNFTPLARAIGARARDWLRLAPGSTF